MTLESLVAEYGSFGLFLGAGLEGEAVAMLGGIMSHRHLIGFWTAIVSLALGSFIVDQAFFQLGYWYRNSARVRSIQRSAAGARVLKTFNSHPYFFVLSFRFMYGLRIAGAVTIGTTDFPWLRFVLLNAVAALFWAVVWVSVGYVCGQAIEALFGRLGNLLHFALAGVAVCVCVAILTVIASKRKRSLRSKAID